MTNQASAYWFSKKGAERNNNCDACALFSNEDYCLTIIGDASEKSHQGREFVTKWMTSVVAKVANEKILNCEIIINIMKIVHQDLRLSFASSKACWSALFIDYINERTWTFSCGDCRIGQESEDGTIKWLTPVHTLANWCGEEFLQKHASSDGRHQVTRTLNSKRFTDPEILEVSYAEQAIWILATDGYWIEQKMENVHPELLKDDASYFRVPNGVINQRVNTDADNFYQVIT
nr:hypothetical protein [uncultured Undibacterium sp.]